MSNSLLVASEDGCLASAVTSDKWFAESLVPILVEKLKSCGFGSNNAYEAACGLTSLAKCSSVAKHLVEDNSAVDALRFAYGYGQHSHELLSNEAGRCLIAMGSSI